MSKFNRIMVALDLSSIDTSLLQYTFFLTKIFEVESIYFVHVIPDLLNPKNLDVEFHQLFSPSYPVDEKIRDKFSRDINKVFGESPTCQIHVEVREGKPYDKVLHWIEVKSIDLLVVGQKTQSEGSGITARRIARNAGINVLFVPEITSMKINRVVVPVDFSELSTLAINNAVLIQKALAPSRLEIKAVNVISRPSINYYSGSVDSKELREALLKRAKLRAQEFLDESDLKGADIDFVFIDDYTSGIALVLQEYLEENSSDLILIGAKGHSPFETFLYGSVTEVLIEQYRKRPILVLR